METEVGLRCQGSLMHSFPKSCPPPPPGGQSHMFLDRLQWVSEITVASYFLGK